MLQSIFRCGSAAKPVALGESGLFGLSSGFCKWLKHVLVRPSYKGFELLAKGCSRFDLRQIDVLFEWKTAALTQRENRHFKLNFGKRMPYYAAKVWLKSQDACKLIDELRQKISEYLRQECTVIDSAGKEQSEQVTCCFVRFDCKLYADLSST